MEFYFVINLGLTDCKKKKKKKNNNNKKKIKKKKKKKNNNNKKKIKKKNLIYFVAGYQFVLQQKPFIFKMLKFLNMIFLTQMFLTFP